MLAPHSVTRLLRPSALIGGSSVIHAAFGVLGEKGAAHATMREQPSGFSPTSLDAFFYTSRKHNVATPSGSNHEPLISISRLKGGIGEDGVFLLNKNGEGLANICLRQSTNIASVLQNIVCGAKPRNSL